MAVWNRPAARCGAGPAPRLYPRIEADVVVVAPSRQKGRVGAEARHQLEAEHVAVETERAVEVADFEVDVANARGSRQAVRSIRHCGRIEGEKVTGFGPMPRTPARGFAV